jgi:hypothetical protein
MYEKLKRIALRLFESHMREVESHLSVSISAEKSILESSYFKWRFEQITYLREI